MRNPDFDQVLKDTLESAAQEIQENPKTKNEVMRFIAGKESSRMRNKKQFSRRVAVVVGLVACLSAGTALASSGVISGWVSSSTLSTPQYETVAEVNEAQADLGFTPYLVDTFDNGFQFDRAELLENDAVDADGNTISTVKQLSADYINADGQHIQFNTEKMPASLNVDDQTVYEGSRSYQDVTMKYNIDAYKIVSEGYVPSAEEEELVAAGQLFISVDSDNGHEPQNYDVLSVSWNLDGVDYRIWTTSDDADLTEADLYAMAEEIIDLQLAD